MEDGNGKKLEHRLTTVETKLEFIREQVSNHLPSQIKENLRVVDEKIKGLQTKFWWVITLLVATLVSVVVTLLRSIIIQ